MGFCFAFRKVLMDIQLSMASKAILSAAIKESAKKQNEVESKMMAVENGARENKAFVKNLMCLPQEVLLLILEMLPPTTLLVLMNAANWIKQLVPGVKVLSCAECTFINHQDLKTLLKPIGPHLRELYLDNLVSVKSTQLTQLICRCKLLKVLSLRNSGVMAQHMYTIFEHVKLEVLRFTFIDPLGIHPLKHLSWNRAVFASQMKKLHIEVGDLSQFHHFIQFFLSLCHSLTELAIDFSVNHQYNSDIYNADNAWRSSAPPDLPHLNHLIVTWPTEKTMMVDRGNRWKEIHLMAMLQWIFSGCASDTKWKKLWVPEFLLTDVLEKCKVKPESLASATCLFLKEGNIEDLSLDVLQKCPPDSIRQFGFYVPKLNESHVQFIQHACGSSLKQLAAVAGDRDNILVAIKPFYQVLKSCIHITDLDISGIHVTDREGTSFCHVISVLKDLRRLCLPICAITDIPVHVAPAYLSDDALFAPPRARKRTCHHNALNHHAQEMFTQMVTSCPFVEDFRLTGCARCGRSDTGNIFCETIISDIYKWRRLKHLSVESIQSLRMLTFLDSVVERCEELTSLHLINVGHSMVFHFIPSLVKVLKFAINFKFLRIVHRSFHWGDACFWEAVAKAKNLEGLCITSEVYDNASGNIILLALKQLPRFHVFHLYCKLSTQKQTLHQRLRTMIGKNTGRTMNMEMVNVIFNDAQYDCSTGYMREPHCQMFHCGIRDTCTNRPWFS